jgi:oligoendopeptidase F
MYQKESSTFLDKFDDMLSQTTKASIEDVGRIMGVDLTSKDFWMTSLESVKTEIEEVCEMLEKNRH